MPELVLAGVSKVFPAPGGGTVAALREINLTVATGELLTVVGPSGSGKTTLLRLLAGLDQPTSGTISLDGRVVNTVEPQDRETALMFQNHALFPHLTVQENLALGLTLRRAARAEIAQRVTETADWLGLAGLLDRLPQTLSGGERQRVALGRALIQRPRLLLLDEPLSDLDAPQRTELRAEILRLRRHFPTTLIYVTHDQVEAMTLGDRMLVLRSGVIQQVDDPLTVYRSPVNRFVAGFIGSPSMAFFSGRSRARDGALWFVGDDVGSEPGLSFPIPAALVEAQPSQFERPLVVGVRPEHLRLHAETGGAGWAVVELVQRTGAANHLHLTAGPNRFTAFAGPDFHPSINSRWHVSFDPVCARFFDAANGQALG